MHNLKDHIFRDKDITGVTADYRNIRNKEIELLLAGECTTLLIHKKDVEKLARYFKLL